jgi:hypothetical protein
MLKVVTKISAIGTRGEAKGQLFIAKPDSQGRFVLNKKLTSPISGNTTNRAVNKYYVDTLTEAARLLSTNDYLINLISPDGRRALREFRKVKIEYAGT